MNTPTCTYHCIDLVLPYLDARIKEAWTHEYTWWPKTEAKLITLRDWVKKATSTMLAISMDPTCTGDAFMQASSRYEELAMMEECLVRWCWEFKTGPRPMPDPIK